MSEMHWDVKPPPLAPSHQPTNQPTTNQPTNQSQKNMFQGAWLVSPIRIFRMRRRGSERVVLKNWKWLVTLHWSSRCLRLITEDTTQQKRSVINWKSPQQFVLLECSTKLSDLLIIDLVMCVWFYSQTHCTSIIFIFLSFIHHRALRIS